MLSDYEVLLQAADAMRQDLEQRAEAIMGTLIDPILVCFGVVFVSIFCKRRRQADAR